MDYNYKIVDTFNGYEGNQKFSNRRSAQKALDRAREDFYKEIVNRGCQFRLDIVPTHCVWYFDQRQNSFVWG